MHIWDTLKSPGCDLAVGHGSQSHFKAGLVAVVGGDGIATDIHTVGMDM